MTGQAGKIRNTGCCSARDSAKKQDSFNRIVNLFTQGKGDGITFDSKGFSIKDCRINGTGRNFAEYLLEDKIDTRLPLVADYHGTMVNVSFQKINEDKKTVDLYAPVFPGIKYKIASPVTNYVKEFGALIPKGSLKTISRATAF